jgi:hypothetical protein
MGLEGLADYSVECAAQDYEASFHYHVLRTDKSTFWVMKKGFSLHHSCENKVGFDCYLIPNFARAR